MLEQIALIFGSTSAAILAIGGLLMFMFKERYKSFLRHETARVKSELETQRNYQSTISKHFQDSTIAYYDALEEIRFSIRAADLQSIPKALELFMRSYTRLRMHAFGTEFERVHEEIFESLQKILLAINANRGDATQLRSSLEQALRDHEGNVELFLSFYHTRFRSMLMETP